MIRTIRWFERTFTFDLPGWMYPNVVERVRGTPARLADRLVALPPHVLTKRVGEDWSAQEHAGHLLDLESLGLARLDDYEAGRESLRTADLENRKTYQADHNANSIRTILDSFAKERAEFVRRIEEYDEAFVVRSALHPRLQSPMRVIDLVFFTAEHDDHHFARITELIRGPSM